MNASWKNRRFSSRGPACWLVVGLCAGALLGCGGGGGGGGDGGDGGGGTGDVYTAHALVSDGSVPAGQTDPLLKNPWGIAFNPTGFVWVANNHSSSSILYNGNGVRQLLIVSMAPGSNGDSAPTGIVFNGGQDFVLSGNGVSGAAPFIFAGENGALNAWAPTVDGTHALKVYDDGSGGAIYKGLALASNGRASFLYATDFHNNKIDVFDTHFAKLDMSSVFKDPNLPVGYAPFGIQNIGGKLYVSYARQDDGAEDNVAGAGFGYVNLFDTSGTLLRRVASGGPLNAPWGMALAPASGFGSIGGALLIGNFGDGTINAFRADTGAFLGKLADADGKPIVIEGLWGIAFGNGMHDQPTTTLFYAAGPDDEVGGAYGRIDPASSAPPPTLAQIQSQVFGPICSVCHTGGGSSLPSSMNLSSAQNSFANLVSVASIEVPGLMRIKPGDPDNSYLVHKISGTQAVGARMPLGGAPLSQTTINMIRDWVSAGAQNN